MITSKALQVQVKSDSNSLCPLKKIANARGYSVEAPNEITIGPEANMVVPLGFAILAPTGSRIKVINRANNHSDNWCVSGSSINTDGDGGATILLKSKTGPVTIHKGTAIATFIVVRKNRPKKPRNVEMGGCNECVKRQSQFYNTTAKAQCD